MPSTGRPRKVCEMKGRLGIGVAALALLVLAAPGVSHGGSGSTWHVTVKNPNEVPVKVNVGYKKGTVTLYWVESPFAVIAPGGEHQFNIPGAACPHGLTGFYSVEGKWLYMLDTGCLGGDVKRDFWTACCWNETFEVCRKRGSGSSEYHDEDYGFCKK
jgi:hypothetical protein